MPLPRRRWLQAAAFALATPVLPTALARSQNSKRRSAYPIAPGRSFWLPELSPAGPVVAVVNLYTQHAQIYRNGIAIGYTSVSTGKRGYGTPTGRFQVLEKRRFHRSSTYGNAPMPWMVRLTWSGIAFHSGALPGFPASHGCIRLPASFAPQLFGALSLGDTVAVLNQPADAFTTLAPIDPLGRPLLQPEMLAATAWWREAAASAAPVSGNLVSASPVSASPVSASLLTGAPASLAAPPLALLASLPQQRLFVLEAGQVAAAAPHAQVLVAEPHAKELPASLARWDNVRLTGWRQAVEQADVVAVLVGHQEFAGLDPHLLEGRSVIDATGFWRAREPQLR